MTLTCDHKWAVFSSDDLGVIRCFNCQETLKIHRTKMSFFVQGLLKIAEKDKKALRQLLHDCTSS